MFPLKVEYRGERNFRIVYIDCAPLSYINEINWRKFDLRISVQVLSLVYRILVYMGTTSFALYLVITEALRKCIPFCIEFTCKIC